MAEEITDFRMERVRQHMRDLRFVADCASNELELAMRHAHTLGMSVQEIAHHCLISVDDVHRKLDELNAVATPEYDESITWTLTYR
ncbi:hypothetical protein [Fodinicola acaciae]|uniref:hypothetical protein n=1 Tax=Fodinicola acaciae TaxID=2681555 RepID=UPI0013D5BD2A|nr:hypothetical protein [Fodinicola acaciae]